MLANLTPWALFLCLTRQHRFPRCVLSLLVLMEVNVAVLLYIANRHQLRSSTQTFSSREFSRGQYPLWIFVFPVLPTHPMSCICLVQTLQTSTKSIAWIFCLHVFYLEYCVEDCTLQPYYWGGEVKLIGQKVLYNIKWQEKKHWWQTQITKVSEINTFVRP